jgi:mono/diheme cytochrome c family protein
MSRLLKPLICCLGALALALAASACGSESISVPQASSLHTGAALFAQRCAGCHTLSAAGTHGSAANVRTAQYNNGPNFDVRCERPVARVLYAIENGGFSGAIMPQNVVVGQDARAVANFVANYSGKKAPDIPGVVLCKNEPVGTIPTAAQASAGASGNGTSQISAAAGTKKVKGTTGGPATGGTSNAGGANNSQASGGPP